MEQHATELNEHLRSNFCGKTILLTLKNVAHDERFHSLRRQVMGDVLVLDVLLSIGIQVQTQSPFFPARFLQVPIDNAFGEHILYKGLKSFLYDPKLHEQLAYSHPLYEVGFPPRVYQIYNRELFVSFKVLDTTGFIGYIFNTPMRDEFRRNWGFIHTFLVL